MEWGQGAQHCVAKPFLDFLLLYLWYIFIALYLCEIQMFYINTKSKMLSYLKNKQTKNREIDKQQQILTDSSQLVGHGTHGWRGVPDSRACALEEAWFAPLENLLQVGLLNNPKVGVQIHWVIILLHNSLLKLHTYIQNTSYILFKLSFVKIAL